MAATRTRTTQTPRPPACEDERVTPTSDAQSPLERWLLGLRPVRAVIDNAFRVFAMLLAICTAAAKSCEGFF